MLDELKKQVYKANMDLVSHGLVTFTWGNASALDRKSNYCVIKPSGVAYSKLQWEDMVVVDLDGTVIEGKYRPSSDTLTHLELYKKYDCIGGIVHTHSSEAVAWAQAGRDIPSYGTTHADHFLTEIPCTRALTKDEIESDYERNTGIVIIETFEERNLNPQNTPAALSFGHGPFVWGVDAEEAVYNAVVLEEISRMARNTEVLNADAVPISRNLQEKHYFRKNGAKAYYGQDEIVCFD